MVPNDVKELLKSLIAEERLPIDVVNVTPIENYSMSSDHTTECRIKDVIHQWNAVSKVDSRSSGKTEIMQFYTKTDVSSAGKELLESLDVELLLESLIAERQLQVGYSDRGFRLATLAEKDASRYPVKILHGGIRFEKRMGAEVRSSDLVGVVGRFEAILKEKSTKAKLFHRGFKLVKTSDDNLPLAEIKKIADEIVDRLGINYVLDSYNKPVSEDVYNSTDCTSAKICVSLWRFPRKI
ncbi:hypothetical protein C6497_15965 [Candidatus Poribacteria bacterium]|nr:MAG: hypothetical protein C6497_15965 [Candidatus Poribacteria bacterium]